MVFKKRQFTNKSTIDVAKVAPYLLHLGIVAAVTVYVIGGAYAIRHIETQSPNDTNAVKERTPEPVRERRSILTGRDHTNMTVDEILQISLLNMRLRSCVTNALRMIRHDVNCTNIRLKERHYEEVEGCYERFVSSTVEERTEALLAEERRKTDVPLSKTEAVRSKEDWEKLPDGSKRWTMANALLFCFTVITTIGYGNVAPQTFYGRLFVIGYGLVGVPFTMLAIANLGKFLAALLKSWTRPFKKCFSRFRRCLCKRRNGGSSKERQHLMDSSANSSKKSKLEEEGDESESEDDHKRAEDEDMESSSDAFILFVSFVIYIVIGSFIISEYEPSMNFFEAVYFNFVTLTTIGLGDFVPEEDKFLVVTLVYCAVGLALTTIAIEIAADYLKKIHYFGRKMENVGSVKVWFGGKQITMKQLVKNLGDQFNVPIEDLQDLDLEQFVDNAMRVEAGELSTLRTQTKPYEASNYWRALEGSLLHFVDDDDVIAMQANRDYYSILSEHPPPLIADLPYPDDDDDDLVT